MADHPEIERAIRGFQSGEDSDANFRLIHRTYHGVNAYWKRNHCGQ